MPGECNQRSGQFAYWAYRSTTITINSYNMYRITAQIRIYVKITLNYRTFGNYIYFACLFAISFISFRITSTIAGQWPPNQYKIFWVVPVHCNVMSCFVVNWTSYSAIICLKVRTIPIPTNEISMFEKYMSLALYANMPILSDV